MVLGIFGAGGTGKELYDLIIRYPDTVKCYESIIFVDDKIGVKETYGVQVYTFAQVVEKYSPKELCFLIALGVPEDRENIYHKIKKEGFSLTRWVHPRAEVARSAQIAEGVIVMDSFIDINASIGINTFIYYKAAVGHDTIIKENCIISVGSFVGGHSIVESNVYLGPGASVRDRLHIGKGSVVGINSAVYSNIPDGCSAIGNPARTAPKSSKMF